MAKLAARTVRAPEMHLFTTLGQRRLLFWAWIALRRPAAAGPAAAGRHRVGDPAGRASARVRIRAAAPSADGARSGSGRGHAGRDLRLARHRRRRRGRAERPAARAAGGDGRVRQGPRRSPTAPGSSWRVTSIGGSSSNSACSQANTTGWPRRCRPSTSRWTTRVTIPTSRDRPARPTSAPREVSAGRTRTPTTDTCGAGATTSPTTPRTDRQHTRQQQHRQAPHAHRREVIADREGDQPQHVTGGQHRRWHP